MGERSGVGLAEGAILEALDRLGGRPGRGFVKSARALAAVEERIGLAPGYAYQVLVDLVQPWTMPVPLVSGQGNFGGRGDDPAANYRYTHVRLSPAGQAALAAERGQIAPVPIGLINGNTHREGTRPPFRPQGVIGAVREVLRRPRATSRQLIDIVGPPDFITGCTVGGDIDALVAGRPALLRLQARVRISDESQGVIVVDNLPPYVSTDEVCRSVAHRATEHRWARDHPGLGRATRLPVADVRDHSARDRYWFTCTPEPGAAPEVVADQLKEVYGVSTEVRAALPRPLPAMIRQWVRAYHDEDLPASLTVLEDAIASVPRYAE